MEYCYGLSCYNKSVVKYLSLNYVFLRYHVDVFIYLLRYTLICLKSLMN